MTIFEKIINKEIAANIIYEDNRVIAFLDNKPVNKGHFLVVPKKLSKNLLDIEDNDYIYLMQKAKKLAKEQIKKLNVSGFRMIINNGEKSKQVIFHTHIHIIPSID